MLADGESGTIRLKMTNDDDHSGCPHDIAALEDYRLDFGDSLVPFLQATESIQWERSEEDLPGLRNRTQLVCTCVFR